MTIFDIFGNAIYESSAATMAEALKEAARAGVSLRKANLYKAYLRWEDFRGADMREVNLTMAIIRDTDFRGANCRGADFRDADCTNADFRGANCRGADFRGANCHWADFSGALIDGAKFDLDDVPRIHDIHRRVYEAASRPRALYMELWHTSETTHSRAGWVVTLAGEEGRELEKRLGTPTAAALIYVASDPLLERIPDFYAPTYEALADMRKLAGE